MSYVNIIINSKDHTWAQGYVNALKEINLNALLTSSLSEINKISDENNIALIIVDDSFTQDEAIDIAKEIRANEKNKAVPILFIQKLPTYEDFTVKAAGFSPIQMIPAPVNIDDFKIKVFSHLFAKPEVSEKSTIPPLIGEFKKLQKQTLFLDKSSDIFLIVDTNWKFIYWNSSFAKVVGEGIINRINELDARKIFFSLGKKFDDIAQIVFEKGEWIGEISILKADLKEVITVSQFVLLRDSYGNPEAILIIAHDISEVKSLKSQVERATRMETIGALASGIAHDINNLLSPMVLGASMLKGQVKDPNELKVLTLIETNCKRASDILKNLLGYARAMPGHKFVINPKHIIREVLAMIEASFPKSITIKSNIPKNLWNIYADPTQLHEVILNMAINARDAMPEGGTLEIMAKNITLDEVMVSIEPKAKCGPYVVISIADTGTGMPPEIIDKIFDPFFTTKAPGVGTGLGLSTSKGIVEEHGGFIKVKSTVGKGSTFEVWLPARPEAKEVVEEKQKFIYHGNGETVLVIDDEIPVLETTKTVLEKNGYKVIPANGGIKAVGAIANNRSLIKAALCDIDMPQMDGVSTIQALLVYEPALPIIVMTGLLSPAQESKIQKVKYYTLVKKPFSTEEILEIVYRAVNKLPPVIKKEE